LCLHNRPYRHAADAENAFREMEDQTETVIFKGKSLEKISFYSCLHSLLDCAKFRDKMRFSAAATLAVLATGAVATPPKPSYGPNKVPKGFAYTDGEIFRVDGKPFLYAGSNAYWLPFLEVGCLVLSSLSMTDQIAESRGLARNFQILQSSRIEGYAYMGI